MLKHQRLLLFLLVFIAGATQAQNYYFDRAGKSTSESNSYYYRTRAEGSDNSYKSYYTNGGALYFEGKITNASSTDENKNIYADKCTWYYKNGKTKAVRNFSSDGKENGTSFLYYESGKLWQEIEYKNGKIINNTYKEYNEDGQASRIFSDDFNDNSNDWDLYKSDKALVDIKNGSMEIVSFVKEGTSRYISHPSESDEFTFEIIADIKKLKDGDKVGLIYGFKDWQNYNYFYISSSGIYIGFVYEGVISSKTDGMFSSAITKETPNNIKILTNGNKNIYSINGEVQYSTERSRNFGTNIGIAMSGKSTVYIDKLVYKEIDFRSAASNNGGGSGSGDMDVKASGSGILFGADGYILTNYHVIDNANKVQVEVNTPNGKESFSAKVIQKDKDNDLAILKIDDPKFKKLESLRYAFKENGAIEVGSSVFTIGYPYALSGMGKEAKFTDGKISAKTGFNGAVNSFQTSIPVQPGNSGGPVFNDKGQLIGVINSGIKEADNVSYAIKLNYINNLIELLPETVVTPNDQTIQNQSLEEKIKTISNYVVLIKIK